jgi:GNAT superfamily N-acetyltransferase
VEIVDIGPDDPRLHCDVLPVLTQLRPHLTEDLLKRIYQEGHPQGMRFMAAYYNEADCGGEEPRRRCVGVAVWRICATTLAGRKLYVDDLVTVSDARSQGVGKAILTELTARAQAADCGFLDLDSAVNRKDAHRFYMRERMHINAFHFVLPLDALSSPRCRCQAADR